MPAPDKHKENKQKHKAAGGRRQTKKKKPIKDDTPIDISSDEGVEYVGRQYTPKKRRGIMVLHSSSTASTATPTTSSSTGGPAASSPHSSQTSPQEDARDSDIEVIGRTTSDGKLKWPHLPPLFRDGIDGDDDQSDDDGVMNLKAGPSAREYRSKHSPRPQSLRCKSKTGAKSPYGQAATSSSRLDDSQLWEGASSSTHGGSSHATAKSREQSRHRRNGNELQGEDVGPVIEEVME